MKLYSLSVYLETTGADLTLPDIDSALLDIGQADSILSVIALVDSILPLLCLLLLRSVCSVMGCSLVWHLVRFWWRFVIVGVAVSSKRSSIVGLLCIQLPGEKQLSGGCRLLTCVAHLLLAVGRCCSQGLCALLGSESFHGRCKNSSCLTGVGISRRCQPSAVFG